MRSRVICICMVHGVIYSNLLGEGLFVAFFYLYVGQGAQGNPEPVRILLKLYKMLARQS
ncbi:hypothetical protein MPTK1_4g00170 [Marchantia polymorpha subsp. ruderalis]|uniref:Uncharacterized protein n=2 Tax=Marchantia polymorpha TaxID=3197 RepID=A0AAF6B4S2_MARPO|nr:hypothetical protein MARPO_0162s0004 [Marchantia polymorpha]BBN07006.1 hypothetical protein Mp_4g00170 [Marchantia polymorpha subsp. ruderalis]|eukprot:PTQ28471.1 hypothetical protein MARPO_0162s0004 [Marchantia polymorpha]